MARTQHRARAGGARARILLGPAALASALLATAALSVIAGTHVAARTTSAMTTVRTSVASTPADSMPGWRVVAEIGPPNADLTGTLTAHSAKSGWAVWTGADFSAVDRFAAGQWRRVALPAALTGYVQSALAFDGDSASDFWLFSFDHPDTALRFAGTRWALQTIPSWVVQRSAGLVANATAEVFGPGDVWLFSTDAAAYAAHYNGRSWSKVKLPGIPGEVAATGPDDIMATTANSLLSWNGKKWSAVKIPSASGNVAVAYTDLGTTGPKSAWMLQTVEVPGGGPVPPTDVLHWNGKSWQLIESPASFVGSLAPDGAGGLWASGLNLNPGGFWLFYHLRDGKWTEVSPPAGVFSHDQENLTWIPGTRSLWGVATGVTATAALDSVILKYGP